MTTNTDIESTVMRQVERDLRDKPVWRLMYTGIALLGLGLLVNIALGEADPLVTERWDGPAAVTAVIGGIFIAASWVVRILQRGRREETAQEISLALGGVMAKLDRLEERQEICQPRSHTRSRRRRQQIGQSENPVDPRYLADMSEAVRLGEELAMRKLIKPPDQTAN